MCDCDCTLTSHLISCPFLSIDDTGLSDTLHAVLEPFILRRTKAEVWGSGTMVN